MFVSVDFQGDGKLEPVTEANLPVVWREMGFSVNNVNAARDFVRLTPFLDHGPPNLRWNLCLLVP